ncbi:MAG TPA: YceI family protein [Bacteroidia bacterium]|nr:YceI family protein [Bacteroidia bacterium]
MKKTIFISALLACFALVSFMPVKLHTDIYKLDTKTSTLEWYASKLSGNHHGTINFSGGEIHNNHNNLTGSVEVDMNTIRNSDISDETYKAKLEGHLKSPDFFDAAKYPKSTFVITSITPVTNSKTEGATHNVKGNLTIKDKTNEITFDAVVNMEPDKISCTGTATVDRSKFDVRYGSKAFFPEIGDKIIYDEFSLKFNLVAVK